MISNSNCVLCVGIIFFLHKLSLNCFLAELKIDRLRSIFCCLHHKLLIICLLILLLFINYICFSLVNLSITKCQSFFHVVEQLNCCKMYQFYFSLSSEFHWIFLLRVIFFCLTLREKKELAIIIFSSLPKPIFLFISRIHLNTNSVIFFLSEVY